MTNEKISELLGGLQAGKQYLVTVKDGNIGCSDVQDACAVSGFVVLYKKKEYFYIDTVDVDDAENLLCVDDPTYIANIVLTYKEITE